MKYEDFLNKQNEIYNVNRVNYPYRDKKLFGLSYESSYSFDVFADSFKDTASV